MEILLSGYKVKGRSEKGVQFLICCFLKMFYQDQMTYLSVAAVVLSHFRIENKHGSKQINFCGKDGNVDNIAYDFGCMVGSLLSTY